MPSKLVAAASVLPINAPLAAGPAARVAAWNACCNWIKDEAPLPMGCPQMVARFTGMGAPPGMEKLELTVPSELQGTPVFRNNPWARRPGRLKRLLLKTEFS